MRDDAMVRGNTVVRTTENEETSMSRVIIVVRLLRMVSSLRRSMSIAITLGTLNHLSNIALVAWGAYLISLVILPEAQFPTPLQISFLFILAIVKAVCSYIEQTKNHDVAFRLLAHLRTKIYGHLEPLAPAKLMNKRSGDITSTVGGDIELIEVFFAHTISPVSIASIVSGLVLVFMATRWIILPFVLLPFYVILGIGVPVAWERVVRHHGQKVRNTLGETHAHLTDSLQGLETILLFNQGPTRRKEIAKRGRFLNKLMGQHASSEGILQGLISVTVLIADIIFIAFAAQAFFDGYLNAQELIVVAAIAISSFGPVSAVGGVAHHLTLTFAAAERLFKIMDEEPEVTDSPECSHQPPPSFEIEFKDVEFAYSSNSPALLSRFNLDIPQATSIAIIGESGCGKSTILRLLLRFWDVNSGLIAIGGVNVKEMCLETLQSLIAVVSHDSHLFDATIKENIAIGNPNATMKEIVKCAMNANIHDFIETLPEGYDTSIGELGDNLSGGERQRIIISRALLKDTPILVLDEPTSYLDALSENVVQETLNNIAKDRTVIIVTHRLSPIADVDNICVLNKGQCQKIQPGHKNCPNLTPIQRSS